MRERVRTLFGAEAVEFLERLLRPEAKNVPSA
jgi:hypothetical protein